MNFSQIKIKQLPLAAFDLGPGALTNGGGGGGGGWGGGQRRECFSEPERIYFELLICPLFDVKPFPKLSHTELLLVAE